MKKRGMLSIFLCLAFFASLGFSMPQEEDYYDYSFARLNYVKGDVFIQRAEDLGYDEGTVNLPIVEGDKLGTQDGRAEIHFGRKNYLRVDNYTQVDFAKLPRKAEDFIILHLLSGNIYLRVNTMSVEKEFEIHSPDGSFYILEEGLYRIETSDSRETAVSVMEGSIEAAGEEGFEIIRAGERLVVANGYFTSGPQNVYAANVDAFAEWNRGRDIFHNRNVRTRYLPVEISEYEAELDYYGQWVYERPYGYVWIPDVYHDTWRPYYHGRWVWYASCGWTWCSYEPWGWWVSHYGRWHWKIGWGWYWIPTRRWGPAWVHWYHGGDYLGWSPLSYYNRPVVIVNNRFYGRYYDSTYPVHSRAFTVIRKDQLSARHVAKVAVSSSQLSRLGKVSLSSRQPTGRPAVSSIGIKNSVAAKALSRSNIRSIPKSYSSGNAVRSPLGVSGRSGTVNKGSIRSTQGVGKATSTAKTSIQSRSGIKTYPSRGRSNMSISRSSSRSSSSGTGIKTYPSLRSSVRNSQAPSTSRARSVSPGISQSTRSTIKRYSPSSSSSPRSSYSSPSRSSYSPSRLSSSRSSSGIRTYSSSGVSSSRGSSPSSSSRYSSPSRSSISSRLSRQSSLSRTFSRSVPSRSSSRIKSVSPSRSSYSPSRLSSSRSSFSSRASKSTSSARISRSRSTPSRSSSARSVSRSGSTRKVKKK